jgi:1-acyl-sn-glycerol-3-phosphate acyltransferase
MRAAGLLGAVAELLVEARLSPGSTIAYADRAQRTAHRILERHSVTVETLGPRPVGRAVVVANHLGYLDPLVVSSVLPCVSVAKGEVRGWPLIGRGLEDLGVLFVRRGDPHSGARTIRAALRALAHGAAVLNFPEGTTSDGLRIGPFSRGAFGMARIAGVPIVPARIVYDDPGVPWVGGEAFLPHYLRLCRLGGVRATVRFGAPFEVRRSDDPSSAASRARDIVGSMPAT